MRIDAFSDDVFFAGEKKTLTKLDFVSLADAQGYFTESNLLDKCSLASNIFILLVI